MSDKEFDELFEKAPDWPTAVANLRKIIEKEPEFKEGDRRQASGVAKGDVRGDDSGNPRRSRGHAVDDVRRELAGKDLACWCKPEVRWCHVDVLLRVAAGGDP